MNAVNLIPADARRRRPTASASPLTMGIIGGLVVVLIAAVLYVSAVNDVTARKSELARVTASVTSWQAAANSFSAFEATAQQRQATLDSVTQLASGRYAWETLLSQISRVMPAKAALGQLQATTANSSTTPTSSTTSTTPAATGTTAAAAPDLPAVQLNGCAASQATVAQTMVQLRRVTGVSGVSLASATDTGATSSGTSGGCPFPVTFQLSLTFSAPPASTASTGAAGGTTTAPATATPTAAAAAATTGAAQ